MCTVSIVPRAAGTFRLMCNRDERRIRPSAGPPALRVLDGAVAVWPSDPAGGGTWIGANDAGLALVILNRHPSPGAPRRKGARSRGTIIPDLLRARSLASLLRRLRSIPAGVFEPFTLLALHGSTLLVARNVSGRVRVSKQAVTRPVMFTSSSIGDRRVSRPRRELFRQMVERAARPLAGQRAYHMHAWKARPEISVRMARADAATVSRTTLHVGSRVIRMDYLPLCPFQASGSCAGLASLPRARTYQPPLR